MAWERRWRRRHVLGQHGDELSRRERRLPDQHLVEDHAQGVEIGARVDGLSHRLLGGHVLGRAEDRADLGQGLLPVPFVRAELGDAEVEDLGEVHVTVPIHQHDVVGLQVPVDDARLVGGGEGFGDLPRDVDGAQGGERALRVEGRAQAVTLDVLEHEVKGAVFQLPEVQGPGDVRVLDARGGDRFPLEARHDLGHGRHLPVQHLERHRLAHVDVLSPVHGPHAAAPQQTRDPVPLRQDLADQGVSRLVASGRGRPPLSRRRHGVARRERARPPFAARVGDAGSASVRFRRVAHLGYVASSPSGVEVRSYLPRSKRGPPAPLGPCRIPRCNTIC